MDSSDLQTTTIQETNVVFEEQRQPVPRSTLSAMTLNPQTAIAQTIQEIPWQLKDIMSRPMRLDTFTWNTTDTVNSVLYRANLPSGILSPSLQMSVISFMTYVRSGFDLILEINSTKFHQGRLLMSWFPAVYDTALVNSGLLNTQVLTSLPHVKVAADTSETAILTVPYANISSAWSRFDYNSNLGGLVITPLNELQTTDTTAASVTVTLYVKFNSPVMNVPVDPSATSFNQRAFVKAQSLSTVISTASSAVRAFASIEEGDVAGAITSGISTIEGAGNILSSISGSNADKPNENQFPDQFIRRVINNPSLGVGQDAVNELSIYPHVQHSVPHDYLGSLQDDMGMKELQKRASVYETFNWVDTLSTGSLLFTIPVCPNYYFQGSSVHIQPTWTTFVGNMFTMWRGSLSFRFEFVGSQFHTGRLLIGFVPGQTAVNSVSNSLEAYQQSPCLIWDIKENHEIEFETPWTVSLPWLNNPSSQKLALAGYDFTNYRLADSISGQIRIYVQNPLATNSSFVSNADINVWVSSDKVEYRRLRSPDFALWNYASPFNGTFNQSASVKPQSNTGVLIQQDQEESMSAPNMKLGNTSVVPDVLFLGESTSHFKDILRRYSEIDYHVVKCPAVGVSGFLTYPVFPFLPVDVNNTAGINNPWFSQSWIPYISSAYSFWSGKLNFKIIIEPLIDYFPITFTVYHAPDLYYDVASTDGSGTVPTNWSLLSSYASVYSTSVIQPAIEVVVPWSQPYPVARVNPFGLSNTPTPPSFDNPSLGSMVNGTLIVAYRCPVGYTPGTSAFGIRLMMSVGDDFQLYYPTFPPQMASIITLPPKEKPKNKFHELSDKIKTLELEET